MKNLKNKLIVLIICLTFLLPCINISSAENLEFFRLSENENCKESTNFKKIYTFYRYGPDGSISPVQVEIDLNNKGNLGDIIADKCEELFENDIEMQKLVEIELENLTFGFICKVKSQGRGFHYKSMILEKIVLRFILFRLGLPRITTILHTPLIFCRYAKDDAAKTTITQIFGKNDTTNKTKIVNGNHSIIAQNFIGYTTWFGRFSKTFFDLIPRAFAGISRFVICIKQA